MANNKTLKMRIESVRFRKSIDFDWIAEVHVWAGKKLLRSTVWLFSSNKRLSVDATGFTHISYIAGNDNLDSWLLHYDASRTRHYLMSMEIDSNGITIDNVDYLAPTD